MRITVIGAGRWGSCIAWYLNRTGHDVTLYGRTGSERFNAIRNTHSNGLLEFDDTMGFTDNLPEALEADTIVISINAQNLRSLAKDIASTGVKSKTFVLCMKGLEMETCCRLSEVIEQEIIHDEPTNRVAVWLGPGHVQDFVRGIVNCMVIDSSDDITKRFLVENFSSRLMRFYYGDDIIGNEIGAATKNVIGIAAGMLDAVNMTALKGALTTRGTYEVSRLIKAMGGNSMTAYGLCHLGDYSATVFSEYSQNRRFGEAFIRGEKYDKLAEGYYTVKPVVMLSERLGVQMPICNAIYRVLYEKMPIDDAIGVLLSRDQKNEYWSN